jgi:hypothetical protein
LLLALAVTVLRSGGWLAAMDLEAVEMADDVPPVLDDGVTP